MPEPVTWRLTLALGVPAVACVLYWYRRGQRPRGEYLFEFNGIRVPWRWFE